MLSIFNQSIFQICVIQRRNADDPVDSSCFDIDDVVKKTKARLDLNSKPAQSAATLFQEGSIEELLKSDERWANRHSNYF